MMQRTAINNQMDNIMSNIFGAGATQIVNDSTHITPSLCGGACKRKTTKRKIKGGASGKVEEVGMIEYADNALFKKFAEAFYLLNKISIGYSSSVYVIPDAKKLDAMIKEFRDTLKEQGIVEKSIEAKKFCIATPLPYKKCIFTTYPIGTTDDYKLDAQINPMKNFGVVKRVNSLNEVYWFKYVDEETIEIHNAHPSGKSDHTTVKLIVVAQLGTFVFNGDLPEPKEFYNKPIVKKLSGGCDIKTMCKYISNGVTEQDGALNFISSVACRTPSNIAACKSAIGGDLINSAFNVLFSCQSKHNNIIGGAMDDDEKEFDEEQIEKTGEELIKDQVFTTKTYDKGEYAEKFKKLYKTTAQKNLSPSESTRVYKENLKAMYRNIGVNVLKADIATALSRSGYSLEDSYRLANNIEEDSDVESFTDISKVEYIGDKICYTSKYNSIINKALLAAPLISLNAKTYSPSITTNARRRRGAKKATKKASAQALAEKQRSSSTKTTRKTQTKRKAQEEVVDVVEEPTTVEPIAEPPVEETVVIETEQPQPTKLEEQKKEQKETIEEKPIKEDEELEDEEESDEEDFADAY